MVRAASHVVRPVDVTASEPSKCTDANVEQVERSSGCLSYSWRCGCRSSARTSPMGCVALDTTVPWTAPRRTILRDRHYRHYRRRRRRRLQCFESFQNQPSLRIIVHLKCLEVAFPAATSRSRCLLRSPGWVTCRQV